jgi:hypothetical protein
LHHVEVLSRRKPRLNIITVDINGKIGMTSVRFLPEIRGTLIYLYYSMVHLKYAEIATLSLRYIKCLIWAYRGT